MNRSAAFGSRSMDVCALEDDHLSGDVDGSANAIVREIVRIDLTREPNETFVVRFNCDLLGHDRGRRFDAPCALANREAEGIGGGEANMA